MGRVPYAGRWRHCIALVSLSAEALAFVRDASKFGWVLMGFDWPTWIQTPEARVFVDDRAAIGRATPDELASS